MNVQVNMISTTNKRKLDDPNPTQIWQARLCHISQRRMHKLVGEGMFDLSDINSLPTCKSCLKGKMTKTTFNGNMERAHGLLDLIHTDVCDPLNVSTKYGQSYFITFTDDHSSFGYVYLIKNKSEAFEKFKHSDLK